MIVDFASLNCTESPTLILRSLDGTPLQTLGFAFDVQVELSYNEVSTLSFLLPAYVDGDETPNYNEVVGMRIVDLVGCGQFQLVDPQEELEGPRRIKSCKGYSLEYEFTKKNIYLEAGTYNFFSGTGTDDNTIIGRIKERLPDWTYDIDSSLIGRYRTFDDTNKKVYDFIKSDLQQSYSCIFDFDTYTRTVHVRSVDSAVPTKQVYLSQDALIKKVSIDEDSDSIVTCLDVNGAEGVDIRSVNPTGTNKIYNLDYFLNTKNFSADLINRWRKWEKACDDIRDKYYQITIQYNMKLLEIVTEQASLTQLESEYTTLDNLRAVIIQGISQGLKTQADLTEVNGQISEKQAEIDALSDVVEAMKSQAVEINSQREDINNRLRFDYQSDGEYVWFTPEEVQILNRYFLEDIIEDSSFVAQTVESYDEDDLNTSVSNKQVRINSPYTSTQQSGSKYFSFKGGTVSISDFSANIIRGTLSYTQDSRRAVFTAYLDGGTVGETEFKSGNITISGTATVSGSSSGSSLSFTVEDGIFCFTKNSTEYEKNQIEWELYEYGKQILREHAGPTYNFTVDCANFLAIEDYLQFQKQLKLGERVYLNIGGKTTEDTPLAEYDASELSGLDESTLNKIEEREIDEILQPYVVSVHLKYDDPNSFSIEFSSSYNSFDHSFSIAKLLDQSVSMGKTLNYKSGMFSSFVNSGASSSVKKFMESALDIAKNRVLSSGNQAITFDDTGIRVRMWEDDSHQSYEPEEIWLVNNMMAFTDDNWETAKMALGKIFDPNLNGKYQKTGDREQKEGKTYYTDTDGTVWNPSGSIPWSTNLYELNSDGMAYGIAAPYIVGTMIAGQNLVIDSVKPDGTNSVFKVDSSGASLYNASFEVANDNRQIVLSPEHGIVVGKNPSIVIDQSTGEETLNESNTRFWVDTDGNAHFSGEIHVGGTLNNPEFSVDIDGNVFANNGTFNGVLRAKALYVAGQNIMTNTTAGTDAYGNTVDYVAGADGSAVPSGQNSKISSDYLSLYGITILDPEHLIDPTQPDTPSNHRTKMTIDGHTGDIWIGSGTYYGGRYYATGNGRNLGAAFYICDGYQNPGDPYPYVYPEEQWTPGMVPNEIGFISFDVDENPEEGSSAHRILFKSTAVTLEETWQGVPIKIESAGNISLQAGVDVDPSWDVPEGVIYIASPTVYNSASFGSTLPDGGRVGQVFFVVS